MWDYGTVSHETPCWYGILHHVPQMLELIRFAAKLSASNIASAPISEIRNIRLRNPEQFTNIV